MNEEKYFFKNIENKKPKENLSKEKTSRENITDEVSSSERIEKIDTDIISARYRILETRKREQAIRDHAGLPHYSEESPNVKIDLEHIKKLEAERAGLELVRQKEGREVANDFARELRDTPKGTFYQKLKRLAGAFVLAGISIFEPGQAIAPELTKQARVLMEVERETEWVYSDFDKYNIPRHSVRQFLDPKKGMDIIKKNDLSLYQDILIQFQEKGGVILSPQLPETIYRQHGFAKIVQLESLNVNPSFYNRPEVILGKEFITENPEKAKEYLEKIFKAIRATVRLEREGVYGSGGSCKRKRRPDSYSHK